MAEYETHDLDVVVVGAGGAGLRAAIIPLKERVVDDRYDPIVWLGRLIRRPTSPSRG